jgi:hypothetical protein
MIRTIAAVSLSAWLLVFAPGCGGKQEPKPDHPAVPATPPSDKPKDHPAH